MKKRAELSVAKGAFAVGGDKGERIAVQFWYEYRDAEDGMKWKRCYGLEDWTFAVIRCRWMERREGCAGL